MAVAVPEGSNQDPADSASGVNVRINSARVESARVQSRAASIPANIPAARVNAISEQPVRDAVEGVRFRTSVEPTEWRRWADEIAVYESRSAQTHLLIDGHAELFALLAARPEPASIDDIAHAFAGDTDLSDDGDALVDSQAPSLSLPEMQALQTLVHELVTLGVVEALPA